MKKKIAVLRANALGDLIFALPALQALRDHFPNCEIVLLGKEMHKRLLEGRPSPVDRVEVIPPYPGITQNENETADEAAISAFFQRMREEHFDVAFQMHGGGKLSNSFVKKLGARLTVGSRTTTAEQLDISIPYSTYFSEVLRYIELVASVGAHPKSLEPRIVPVASDIKEMENVVVNPGGKPVAVIQAGATDPRRWWPGHKFAEVAQSLVERGFHVCFNGVDVEKSLISGIISMMPSAEFVQDLSGKLSLSGLVGLLAKAAVMISNDTGPLHLAVAVGTPTIGLFWAPNMVTSMPMTLENNRPLIAWNTNCPLCGASFRDQAGSACDHIVSFISEITVKDVLHAVDELLDEKIRYAVEVTHR